MSPFHLHALTGRCAECSPAHGRYCAEGLRLRVEEDARYVVAAGSVEGIRKRLACVPGWLREAVTVEARKLWKGVDSVSRLG